MQHASTEDWLEDDSPRPTAPTRLATGISRRRRTKSRRAAKSKTPNSGTNGIHQRGSKRRRG
ncbi:MAG: hypothetical protein AAF805_08840 [Planctomycetota bacterium]